MEAHDVQPKKMPREIIFLPKGPRKGVDSDPILRLAQNSRRIPPSSLVPPRNSSALLSFVLFLNKVLAALVSVVRRRRNLYKDLEKTVNELEKSALITDEKLLALKKWTENQSDSAKRERQKSE